MRPLLRWKRDPDIILADYHLETGTGIDVIEAVRAIHGDIPCVLVTADRTAAVKAQADERGIAMLHKPVRPAGLRSVLSLGLARAGGCRVAQADWPLGADKTKLAERDHGLGAAVDAKLQQDRRNMGLHGCFGHAEFIGDLLVEQAFAEHGKHAVLLRCEALQAVYQFGHLNIVAHR